jgi:hypothetical protein
MSTSFNRRDFLKLGALALSGLAFNAFPYPQDEYGFLSGEIGRVTHSQSLSIYHKPNDESRIIGQLYRDELVKIYQEVTPRYWTGMEPPLVPGLGRLYPQRVCATGTYPAEQTPYQSSGGKPPAVRGDGSPIPRSITILKRTDGS